jgi:MFS family permease
MTTLSNHRNIILLAICQALYTSSISVDLTLTGIVGYNLAANKAFATLPFALITVGAAATTIFASLLMNRIGRKAGFCIGASAATMGGSISVWAIFHQSFAAFCIGTTCVGAFQAFAQYYRFAAADAAVPAHKAQALSLVLTGGVVAAVLGPAIAAWSKDLLAPVSFAGSYAVVTVFGLTSIVALVCLDSSVLGIKSNPSDSSKGLSTRKLSKIAKQPVFLTAVINNIVGYAVMMFIMTATPLASVAYNHSIDDGANIIQLHLLGMFAPSFFTGKLIARYGETRILLTGAILSAGCAVVALNGTSLAHFFIALLLLGIGWNFMYIGASTLLTHAYFPAERAKAQATNEFLTYGATALASLSAGGVLHDMGWGIMNYSVLLPLLVASLTTIWFAKTSSLSQEV